MSIPNLSNVAIGAPITRRDVSFFPLYLPGNALPTIVTGDTSGLIVEELESASVNLLRVNNPTDKPVLVVEGEHFVGGKQNRAVNVTVLVASLSDLDIPVSCLERGRWGRRQPWRRAEAFAPNRVRAAQRSGVNRSMVLSESRGGDQGAVWDEVSALLDSQGVASNTAAASDLERNYRREAPTNEVEELAARGPLPEQCGIAVTHGRRVVAMDLFGSPHLLSAHWSRLVRSHYLNAAAARGSPSANRVLKLVRLFGWEPSKQVPGVGIGVEHRVAGGKLTGQALTLNGAVVHAAFSRESHAG